MKISAIALGQVSVIVPLILFMQVSALGLDDDDTTKTLPTLDEKQAEVLKEFLDRISGSSDEAPVAIYIIPKPPLLIYHADRMYIVSEKDPLEQIDSKGQESDLAQFHKLCATPILAERFMGIAPYDLVAYYQEGSDRRVRIIGEATIPKEKGAVSVRFRLRPKEGQYEDFTFGKEMLDWLESRRKKFVLDPSRRKHLFRPSELDASGDKLEPDQLRAPHGDKKDQSGLEEGGWTK